jgi:hypothetical protein
MQGFLLFPFLLVPHMMAFHHFPFLLAPHMQGFLLFPFLLYFTKRVSFSYLPLYFSICRASLSSPSF